jgi:hypothetical protein
VGDENFTSCKSWTFEFINKNYRIMKKLILVVSIFTLIFTACKKKSKDATPVEAPAATVYPEQNPLAGYLSASGFNQKTTNQMNLGDYEFGISFKATVTGKITALVAKIPDVRSSMRVTIWDKMAGTIYRTELMDITSSGVEVTKTIAALELVKDKEYFITFNSNDWYDHRKTDGSSVTYPFTVGDIVITGYSFKDGAAQALPDSPQTTYYAGDISFKFQRTE